MSPARVVPSSKTRAGILRAIEVWEHCGSNHLSPRETLRLFDERAELLAACDALMALPEGSIAQGNGGESWDRVVSAVDAVRDAVAKARTT